MTLPRDCSLQTDSSESLFIARQPIFSTDLSVWGYELLFRSSGTAQTAVITNENQATSQVIADGFTLVRPGLSSSQKLLINFPEQLLLDETALALPPSTCVIEILETVHPTPSIMEALQKLKQAGFTIAMDDYTGEYALEPFLDIADILKMDILALGADPARVRKALDCLGGRKLKLLAEKVENEEVFRFCSEIGFTLFQGYFFCRPEIIPGKKIPAGAATKLRLLKELSDPNFEAGRIAQIINTDPGLSYRLFRYLNSASFGLRNHVDSVSHAVNMIGQRPLACWLQAVILSDLNPSPRAAEVSFLSLQRARFLELLSQKLDLTPHVAFTLGLFSLLDSLLRVDMSTILDELQLSQDLICALTNQTPSRMSLGLSLVRAYESGDAKSIAATCKDLGIQQEHVNNACIDSLRWVQNVLDGTTK